MPQQHSEHKGYEATSQYQKIIDERLAQLYPKVSPEMSWNSPDLQKYLQRDSIYVALPLKNGSVRKGIISDVLGKALEFGTSPDDPAFSRHAYQHGVAVEAAERLKSQMDSGESLVKVTLEEEIFETGQESEDSTVTKYVLSSSPVERNIYRPFYIEIGIQLKQLLAKFEKQPDQRKKQLRKVIFDFSKNIGVDFAVLVSVAGGIHADEIMAMFMEDNIRNVLKGLPSQSRDGDKRQISALYDLLYSADHVSFNQEKQVSAVELARRRNGWKHAEDDQVWESGKFPQVARSLAVFGGFDFAAAMIARDKASRFKNPAKQKFLDGKSGFATTQLITAYNVYEESSTQNLLTAQGFLSALDNQR